MTAATGLKPLKPLVMDAAQWNAIKRQHGYHLAFHTALLQPCVHDYKYISRPQVTACTLAFEWTRLNGRPLKTLVSLQRKLRVPPHTLCESCEER